ncbi:type II toxin-antitoxin system VapC family toxin [Prochlorothrix hollandica]|uniref:Ribonuclease VapC n=1 Tax=Prochlorothrix hollandica PCC 9006 = CALU 1027 TaxID=317619 RepID=A0A0M2Q257_PROHO|nr:PIN domain nuclease [Prochlorothrix hollandica]KKJ00702.1 twitching motility protein PilT [Prochlorothrix hollandica PCC 9006 = CALU 1027]
MLLIDTSVWVNVFRDRTGQYKQQLEDLIQDQTVYLTRFTQLELLQGSKNNQEWTLLATYLEEQDYLELAATSWVAAARIYYDLRRQGLTVRSPIDCCITQVALEHRTILVHNDRDFDTIAQICPLEHHRFQPSIPE